MSSQPVVLIGFYQIQGMAIRQLDAVLRRANIPTHTIFFKHCNENWTMEAPEPEDIEALIELVKELDPILVGLNVFALHRQLAAQITEKIRRETGTFVVWGGPHPTICPEDCLPHADAVCIGEGEEPLVELASALREGGPFHRLRNLWFRHEGKTIKNPSRPLIQDLDLLPFPTLVDDQPHFIDRGRAQPMPALDGIYCHPLMTSRGCPFRCTFCVHQPLRELSNDLGAYIRRHSVKYVIEEMRRAKRLFPKLVGIQFWDDIFTFDEKWIREFTEVYRGEIGLPFYCYTHPSMARSSILELVKCAGVELMTMGVQSGSTRIRKEFYHRCESNEDILAATRTMRSHGIDYTIDLIVGNPVETFEEHQQTLDLLLSMPRPFQLSMENLAHYPGYALTEKLLEMGAIQREDVEDMKRANMQRSSFLLDMNRKDEPLFWECLFYMASKRSFPASLIRRLSRSRFVRRHPRVFARLLRLTTDSPQAVANQSHLSPLRKFVIGRLLKIYRRLQAYARLAPGGRQA
jgi:radical SAM superfamily enzyme YgiQ (UPF0313 family)